MEDESVRRRFVALRRPLPRLRGHDDGKDEGPKAGQGVENEELASGRGDGQQYRVEEKGGVGQRESDALEQRAVLRVAEVGIYTTL